MGIPLITKAFLLTAVSKKAAHFTVFVKCFFENSYKKLGPAFLQDPAFLNLVTLGQSPSPTDGFTRAQTKIVSPSVKTEGFDTSLTEGGFGVPRLGARGRIATTSLRTGLAMTALAPPLQKGIRSAAGQ